MALKLPPSSWVWIADLDEDDCIICWAMHGSVHRIGTPQPPNAAHPNCDCHAEMRERGADRVLTGEEALEGLPAKKQREILGDQRYEAFARGDLGLQDMVGRSRYGLRVRSLRDLGLT